jgi:NADP-dependent 3-hydroxy acid dehydrogenase YdfG
MKDPDKICIVTGVSSGIGFAIAKALLTDKYTVIATARRSDNLKKLGSEPGLVMSELHNDWKIHPKDSMGITESLTVDNIVDTVRFIIKQPDHVRIPRLMIFPKNHNI